MGSAESLLRSLSLDGIRVMRHTQAEITESTTLHASCTGEQVADLQQVAMTAINGTSHGHVCRSTVEAGEQ